MEEKGRELGLIDTNSPFSRASTIIGTVEDHSPLAGVSRMKAVIRRCKLMARFAGSLSLLAQVVAAYPTQG